VRRINAGHLRRLFNDGGYVEQVLAGALQEHVLRDGHPASPLAGEPFCTRSQSISYRDADGNEVARVHQYLRSDGSIGLSGRPDPKRLLHNGVLYILRLP
jgi:hypothetical protein